MTPKEIRWPRLLVTAVSVALVSAGLWMVVVRSGQLVPQPSWLAGLLVLIMGALVLWFARPVRRHLRGAASSAPTIEALRAARAVVLAQAGALTGAAVAGWYAGQLLVVLGDLSLVANQERAWRLALQVLAAVALMVCGLVAQAWCRVPPPPAETITSGSTPSKG